MQCEMMKVKAYAIYNKATLAYVANVHGFNKHDALLNVCAKFAPLKASYWERH